MGSAAAGETGEERERLEPWLTDASVAVAVTLVISLVIVADTGSSPLPGVAWAIGFGALLLLRRHLPLIVLAVTVFGIFAYYALNLPPIGMSYPLSVPSTPLPRCDAPRGRCSVPPCSSLCRRSTGSMTSTRVPN